MMTKKDCDICKKSGKIHFRVKSINHTKCISAVKNVGILFLKKINILMEGLENYY